MRFFKSLFGASLAALPLCTAGAMTSRDVPQHHVVSPKLFIISMFPQEATIWHPIPDFNLLAHNIPLPGLSPLFPYIHCTTSCTICQITTGEGEINAAVTVSALVFSSFSNPKFNLTKTYFLIASIAGISPLHGTTRLSDIPPLRRLDAPGHVPQDRLRDGSVCAGFAVDRAGGGVGEEREVSKLRTRRKPSWPSRVQVPPQSALLPRIPIASLRAGTPVEGAAEVGKGKAKANGPALCPSDLWNDLYPVRTLQPAAFVEACILLRFKSPDYDAYADASWKAMLSEMRKADVVQYQELKEVAIRAFWRCYQRRRLVDTTAKEWDEELDCDLRKMKYLHLAP
ncbi:purine nucleoside permease-domain-containing protein [Aspergillus pseudoustus]|uniref:Purine nucleoside permease-domain-containing protein n=1 Tax=Aspergillus pseudoustus TaxID=1810923 RepID=A0ABR4IMC2_9EURO